MSTELILAERLRDGGSLCAIIKRRDGAAFAVTLKVRPHGDIARPSFGEFEVTGEFFPRGDVRHRRRVSNLGVGSMEEAVVLALIDELLANPVPLERQGEFDILDRIRSEAVRRCSMEDG